MIKKLKHGSKFDAFTVQHYKPSLVIFNIITQYIIDDVHVFNRQKLPL